MICVNVWLTVKNPDDTAPIEALLGEQGRLSRSEPGCLRFEVYHSKADPSRFLLCEHWNDQAALDVHRTARAYTEIYQPQVLPLVDRDPHPSTLVE